MSEQREKRLGYVEVCTAIHLLFVKSAMGLPSPSVLFFFLAPKPCLNPSQACSKIPFDKCQNALLICVQ